MSGELNGKRIALLAADGVEQVELDEPRKAVEEAGAETVVVSINSGEIQAFNHLDPGDKIKVDVTADSADSAQFDALLLPGGVANPDFLRGDADAVSFVKGFFEHDKPVGVICHGPWTLVEADVVQGRTLTSYPSVRTDIRNAGGHVVDQEVVTDQNITSSRWPEDRPAFCARIVEQFAAGWTPAHRATR